MDDQGIIELYFQRNENAIQETDLKYGSYCKTIAYNILNNHEDGQECVNDTYWHTWNAVPPNKPGILRAYLGKICRNLAIDRWKKSHAKKRGGNEVELVFSELEGCIPAHFGPEEALDEKQLAKLISGFLRDVKKEHRLIFLRRYFYADSVKQIGQRYGFSESKIKSALFHTRNALRLQLEKEGIDL